MRAWVILVGLLTGLPAIAQDVDEAWLQRQGEVHRAIWNGLFNPVRMQFDTPLEAMFITRIEVQYHGNDYDYPVAALAMEVGRRDCLGEPADETILDMLIAQQDGALADCPQVWQARLVRAPALHKRFTVRPSVRGRNLLDAVMASVDTSADIDEAVASVELERFEYTQVTCPQAAPDLTEALQLAWVPRRLNTNAETPGNLQYLAHHADTITLRLSDGLEYIELHGVPFDGTALAWGMNLLFAFDPCTEADGFLPLLD